MDSLANWASAGTLIPSLGNLDRNLDCEGRLSELNGMALNSEWMKLMGLSSAGPNGEGDRAGLTLSLGSADEEFGHWRPVYDEKTRPTFSVTGTEIWQAQKTGSVPTEKTTDWNLTTDVTKTSAAAVTAMESVKCLLRDEETGSEKNQDPREETWCGSSDVHSNSGSMLDVGSSVASNVDSNTGWGTTPICQEKPWDLHRDRALLEAGAAPTGRQDIQKPRDPSQDCSLDLWRNAFMAGEPVGGLMNQKSRGFDGRSLDLFPKSDASDALQLELQKLALMESSHSPDGLTSRSRRGSSVSSIDGISLSSLVGRGDRRDPGVEPNCETLSWVDSHKKLPPQRDEWNHGSAGLQLYTGLQSPSGWSSLSGSEKTPPVVDNGTAVWSKTTSQDKMSDDTLAWVKMLGTQSYPPPPSVFDIDMSVPPPPLNAPSVRPLGVVTPAPPPGLTLPPMLSNLQPSSNLTTRKLGSPLSYMAGPGGLVSPSADISEKPWPYLQQLQQQPVERQRPWTGNQWSNSDQWNNMQRKHQYEAARQQSLVLNNDVLNTGSLNSDHLRGGYNLHPMQYKTSSTVHNKAPQTRSKLIQQLVSMGFKKEDAQNALITYNMDLKKALAELMAKRSMVTPTPYYDPRLNSLMGGGQLPPTTDNVRDALRSSLGGLCGHGMGVGGGGLSDSPLDLSKLISSSAGWDALMQTSSSPLQMLQSGRNPLATGHMPPTLLHSSLQLPPNMHPTARGQDLSAGLNQDDLRQLSDLALCRKLAESSRNSLQPDAELLQLFAKTLSASNSIVPSRDSTSAIYSYGNGLPAGLKLPDHLGSTIQSGWFPSPTLASGPGRSASVEPQAVPAQKGLDGFDLTSSLIGRQFSLNLASSTNQDAAVGLNRSDVSSALQLSPTDVKSSQVDLQKMAPKLEIKEFIPGVPWKGAQETGDQKPAMPTAVETAFKDATKDWPPQTKEKAVQEESVQKCLPSKWLELKNISDQMDDMTLHDLCTRHGQIKVFTRHADGSLLVSYVNLDDAVNAQAAFDQSELNGATVTAEFVKDWTNAGASATTSEPNSLGFMRLDGLWIPPDAEREPAYYGGADEWCEGYNETQPEETWNGETAFEPTASKAFEEDSSSQKQ